MIDSLKKLIELSESYQANKRNIISSNEEIKSLGYPQHSNGMAFPAFDWIAINLRGIRGILIDMYQIPDKLISALKMLTPYIIKDAVFDAHRRGGKRIAVRMYHGAAEFMSEEQYMKFYWPYLKDLLMGLIEAGLMPIPVFEGDSTSVLHLLRELPPAKVTAHFDKVDRKKAKEMTGNVMCFWGNVPEKLLCEGSVQQIKDDVKELIETFGENGGIIIDGASGIPTKAKPENVQALMDAVYEYGVY
jgi:uroporphyrinogen-III decarboxylase